VNRRTFIRASTAIAAAWRAPALLAQREPAAADAPLPSSIAALTSMRDQARPITNGERRARIDKARRLMAEQRLGALVLTGGTSLLYFTNIRWSGGERLFACVIPARGDPFFVCPAFEEDRAMELIARGPFGGGKADIRTWQEDESPYALVARGLTCDWRQRLRRKCHRGDQTLLITSRVLVELANGARVESWVQ
jgi:Xaa-Pro dipeptidase